MYNPIKDGIEKNVKSVRYTEVYPPEHLKQMVHCFWEIKTDTSLPEDFRYHIIPDACINLLFNQLDTNIAAVTALQIQPKTLNLGRLFHYVGVQLLPGIWQGSRSEIMGGYVDKSYSGQLPLIETNKLLVELDFNDKEAILTKLVEKLIEEKLVVSNTVVLKILKNLNEINSVNDMATITQTSSRQLQRILKQTTGFTPHNFLKILRVQQSFKQDYLDLYADQSHFIHSFRKITGYTPKKYINKFDV